MSRLAEQILHAHKFIFEPWVGKNYGKSSESWPWLGNRLLILGESHHFKDTDRDHAGFTSQCVKESWSKTKPWLFFRHIPEIIANRENLSPDETEELWNHVIFYNYIQCRIGESRKPVARDFTDSDSAWKILLHTAKPSHVLFVGKRLWDNVQFQPYGPIVEVKDPLRRWPFELWRLKLDGLPPISTSYILHPTASRPPPPIAQGHRMLCRLLEEKIGHNSSNIPAEGVR